jgi:hypothetical protein
MVRSVKNEFPRANANALPGVDVQSFRIDNFASTLPPNCLEDRKHALKGRNLRRSGIWWLNRPTLNDGPSDWSLTGRKSTE